MPAPGSLRGSTIQQLYSKHLFCMEWLWNVLIQESLTEGYPHKWLSSLDQHCKDNCNEIAIPLTDIINCMLATSTYPSMWMCSENILLPKVKSPATYKDYRPISLLWHCGKTVEFFLANAVHKTVSIRLSTNQSAYSHGVRTTDAWVYAKSLDQKTTPSIHCLYADSKAFDKMRPDILVWKMSNLAIDGHLIHLAYSFLTDNQ